MFIIISLFILFGVPTNPSSLTSGITSIILLFFVFIDIALDPFFFKEATISLLKLIKTVSTMFITLSSVTLSPLINLD